jgi:mannose-1-phosphate guanylyltransferase
MKAFILAAGEGRRLRPLTDALPKCLVPVDGTPLLGLWLKLLRRHGVSDVLINMHHAHERLVEFVADDRSGVRIELSYERELLGSAGTVAAHRPFVSGESDFLIVYSDVLTTANLTRLVEWHRGHAFPMTIGVTATDKPREKGTVVIDDAGRVVAFEEKAPQPRSNLANAGIYVARATVFETLEAARPAQGPFDFGHHVLPQLVPNLCARAIDEFLLDIGTPEAYALAQTLWPDVRATDVVAP